MKIWTPTVPANVEASFISLSTLLPLHQEITQKEMFQKEYYPKNPHAQKSITPSNSKSRAWDSMIASHSCSTYWHQCTRASLQKPSCQSNQSATCIVQAIRAECTMDVWDPKLRIIGDIEIANCEASVTHKRDSKDPISSSKKEFLSLAPFSRHLFCHLFFCYFSRKRRCPKNM